MARHGGERESQTAKDTPHRRRLLIRAGQVLIVLLLCGIAGILLLRWHWRHEFSRRIEAIRAAGYPVTPKEHDAWYEWPQSGENAAFWIMGAAEMCNEPKKEDREALQRILALHDADRPDPGQPLGVDIRAVLEQYIQANAGALESLHEATTIAECRYPVDLSGGPGTTVRHVSEVRECVQLLCLEAVLHAERGDPNEAGRAIRAALHVANSLDNEPLMISHMVRMSGLITAAAALERVLNRVEFTDRQFDALYQAFRAIEIKTGLLRALAGQRCMICPLFGRPRTIDRGFFDRLPPRLLLEGYYALGLSAREGAVYLDFVEECLRIVERPVSQYRRVVDHVQARYFRGRKGLLLSGTGYMFTALSSEATYVSRLEIARVSLAVERYRRAHGKLPETLDSLIPDDLAAVPEDPFDETPLRYKRLDSRYVVYSVGEDGKDDGGDMQPASEPGKSGRPRDYAFRICR